MSHLSPKPPNLTQPPSCALKYSYHPSTIPVLQPDRKPAAHSRRSCAPHPLLASHAGYQPSRLSGSEHPPNINHSRMSAPQQQPTHLESNIAYKTYVYIQYLIILMMTTLQLNNIDLEAQPNNNGANMPATPRPRTTNKRDDHHGRKPYHDQVMTDLI